MSADVELPKTLSESHALIEAQQEKIEHLNQKYESLLEQIKLAKLRQFGRKSESHPEQCLLFDEVEQEATLEEEAPEDKEQITYERQKAKRKPLPENLPREEIIVDIDEADKVCECGCAKKHIGEEVTEQLEVIPASVKVIATVRPKYACNRCDNKVSIAPMPKHFMPKSMATPSLVAHIITNKYCDHLPLYRQEQIWKRVGIELPRNTQANWIIKAYEACLPLRDVFIKTLFKSDYLQVDETPFQVMNEPNRKNTSKSYLWVYHSLLPDKKLVLYDYKPTREGKWPQQFMQNFKGYLQTDGYGGYDWAKKEEDITQLGCWAHARRPFAELVKIAKTTGKSHQAIAYIKKLYAIEKTAKTSNLNPIEVKALRTEKAKPILDDLFKWVRKALTTAVPESKLGKALKYIHEREDELSSYLEDGRLQIDNNAVENKIRPFAIGRKNWMIAASTNGAEASSFFYSLINSAKENGLNPFDYLNHLFNHIKQCKTEDDYMRLMPHICKL